VLGEWTGRNQIYSPLEINEVFDVFLRDFQIHTPPRAPPAHFQVFQRYLHWVWGDPSEQTKFSSIPRLLELDWRCTKDYPAMSRQPSLHRHT